MTDCDEDKLVIEENVGVFEDLLHSIAEKESEFDSEIANLEDFEAYIDATSRSLCNAIDSKNNVYNRAIVLASLAIYIAQTNMVNRMNHPDHVYHLETLSNGLIKCSLCDKRLAPGQASDEPCWAKLEFQPGSVVRSETGKFGYIKDAKAPGVPPHGVADPHYTTLEDRYLKIEDEDQFEEMGVFRPTQESVNEVPKKAYGQILVHPGGGDVCLWTGAKDNRGRYIVWNESGGRGKVADYYKQTDIFGYFSYFAEEE